MLKTCQHLNAKTANADVLLACKYTIVPEGLPPPEPSKLQYASIGDIRPPG